MEIISLAGSGLALVAVLLTLLSERARAIWRSVFRSPRQRSVVISIDGDTLLLQNVSQEDMDRLAEAFLTRQAGPLEPVKEEPSQPDRGADDE